RGGGGRAEERPLRRQGRGGEWHLRRLARDRQRDPRCGRRAADVAACEPREHLGEAEVRREIQFQLNGRDVSAQVAPHESLVEVLRESFGLYGARESCGQGMCGCCTVVVDGRAVSGCLYLATLVEGSNIETVE